MADRLDGLRRYMFKEPHGTVAVCQAPGSERCGWTAEGAAPETIAAKARQHTRETGHDTRVNYHQIVEYSREG
jgi:hypothetical protein